LITAQDYKDIMDAARQTIPVVEAGLSALVAKKALVAKLDADFTANYGRPSTIVISIGLGAAVNAYLAGKAAIFKLCPVSVFLYRQAVQLTHNSFSSP
jgi:hypothetical protein